MRSVSEKVYDETNWPFSDKFIKSLNCVAAAVADMLDALVGVAAGCVAAEDAVPPSLAIQAIAKHAVTNVATTTSVFFHRIKARPHVESIASPTDALAFIARSPSITTNPLRSDSRRKN